MSQSRGYFRIPVYVCIVCMFALVFPCAADGPAVVEPPKELKDIRAKISKIIEKNEAPSIAVAVARKGKIIWMEALGWANREKKKKATPQTMYKLASIGKSITATAVMVLVEQGKIDLDAPLNKYIAPQGLRNHDGTPSTATVRQLLHFTAGIPHGWSMYKDHSAPLLPLKTFVQRYGVSTLPPGEKQIYSNLNYQVAEYLIERVSGMSYAQFLETAVFTPLGLKHMSVSPEAEKLPDTAAGYNQNMKAEVFKPMEPVSSLGIFASVRDLLGFGMFHLKNRLPKGKAILRDKTLDLMHYANQVPGGPPNQRMMALGWGNLDLGDGHTMLLTNGGAGGACSALFLEPSRDIAVACLTNMTSSNRITDELALEIMDALVPSFAQRFGKVRQDYMKANFGPFQPTPGRMGQWEGEINTYEGSIPVSMTFQPDGDIHIQLKDQYKTLLHDPGMEEGFLRGSFYGTVFKKETQDRLHNITLRIRLKDKTIQGSVSVYYENDRGYFLLPASIRLEKKK